jgi:hypothetical protein
MVPHYDKSTRTWRLGETIIKVFRQPAPAQETILSAFQEQRWRKRIDDPLPRQKG